MRPLAFFSFILFFLTSCVRTVSTPPTATPVNAPTATLAVYQVPYPLTLGSTWIYEYSTFSAGKTVLWRITEVITETKTEADGSYYAKMQRTSQLISGQPDDVPMFQKLDGFYWYILKENQLYLQLVNVFDQNLINQPALIKFPLSTDYAGPSSYTTRAAEFNPCYIKLSNENNATGEQVFCENIGFVSESFQQADGSAGYKLELIGYSIPEK